MTWPDVAAVLIVCAAMLMGWWLRLRAMERMQTEALDRSPLFRKREGDGRPDPAPRFDQLTAEQSEKGER